MGPFGVRLVRESNVVCDVTNIHNVQSVILLWALTFKAISAILWIRWGMTRGGLDFARNDPEKKERLIRAHRFCTVYGSITGGVGLILLSVYILMNMG